MRFLLTTVIIFLAGCSSLANKPANTSDDVSSESSIALAKPESCLGTTTLPPALLGSFVKVDNPELLASTLGEPNKGKLCQGAVYESKAGASVVLYRAWNSTNPGSEMGTWWAFYQPEGPVAQYRSDYEICYQWSPLDKMTRCRLKAGTTVVVGNGQSAECSPYLRYPVSAVQQVFLEDASSALENCTSYNGMFSWSEN